MPEDPNNETPEVTLENVVEVPVEELNDDQKTFIKDNADNLTDEQKEVYKSVLEPEESVNPEDIEPETRTPAQKKKEEEEPETPEDEEIAPEDEETIGKVVDKRLKGVSETLKEVQAIKDRQEVDAFIAVKPEYGKYREVMIKFIQHPAYANVPVHNIAAIVAAKDLQKMGAEKEREAARKAKETGGGGQTQRKVTPGKVDWSTASKEDFEAHKAKVLGQG